MAGTASNGKTSGFKHNTKVAAVGAGARHGLLIKGGVALEQLDKVDTLVVDKTGTLTTGPAQITELVRFDKQWSKSELLAWAAALEHTALFAPLVFLGGFWAALIGMALWGGIHESIIPAAAAQMVPIQRRASACGLFKAGYSIFWFLGSTLIGILYTVFLPVLIGFSLLACFSCTLFGMVPRGTV